MIRTAALSLLPLSMLSWGGHVLAAAGSCHSTMTTLYSGTSTDLLVETSEWKKYNVIQRECPSCSSAAHRAIVYKRLTTWGGIDVADLFLNNWFSAPEGESNLLNVDFELYSSLEDANSGANKWTYCNYDDPGVGFPRDCGASGAVGGQWTGPTRSSRFATFKGLEPSSTDASERVLVSGELTIDLQITKHLIPLAHYQYGSMTIIEDLTASLMPLLNSSTQQMVEGARILFDVKLSSNDCHLVTFEYKENNDRGFIQTIDPPLDGWKTDEWQSVDQAISQSAYKSEESTDWSHMNRLELYGPLIGEGQPACVDQVVTIRNLFIAAPPLCLDPAGLYTKLQIGERPSTLRTTWSELCSITSETSGCAGEETFDWCKDESGFFFHDTPKSDPLCSTRGVVIVNNRCYTCQ